MKKSIITLAVMLAATALVVVFCGSAMAKVTGVCANCHTMHNSQGGSDLAGGPRATLLTNSCVGCHSSGDSTTISNEGGCPTPVVNYTGGSEPTEYLAGGNFWWVATEAPSVRTDAKGHNVFVSNPDGTLTTGAPGGWITCDGSCHESLATAASGCQGCHVHPAHHADDSATVIGAADNSTDGYYRFLSGAHTSDYGVCGIEDPNWESGQPNLPVGSHNNHNEYLGYSGDKEHRAAFYNLGHTMTGFCCGCHGNFHVENTEANGSGSWIRHPSDAVIPSTAGSEYADAFAGGYDPLVPVARPTPLSAVGDTVEIGTDMVMCLSCHRPHASPYDDLLRWDYGDMLAGGYPSGNTTGCFACHTKKDTGG